MATAKLEQFVKNLVKQDTINELRQSLTNKNAHHVPWTSGVVPLSEPQTTLFYERTDGTSRSLKLGSTTKDQAEDLSGACQPATFGLNQEDVLDETYRKAGKMDAGKFAWLFNPSDHDDFTSRLASSLFPWNSLDKGIRFELYKLNVYGQGSFFKAHQDTPRNENMFGSLVVVLPFEHEGGELILRHRGHEFIFDGQTLLKGAPLTSVAYVAFFSDVEHEVAEVTSGHRVTVTYNLYFDSTKGAPTIQAQEPADPQLEHPFKTQLRKIKENVGLQFVHPVLGFGLEHAYPFETAMLQPESLHLKGNDATLIKVLKELGIEHKFFLLYREDKDNRNCPFRILSINVIEGNEDCDEAEDVFGMITNGGGSWLVWDKNRKEVKKNPPRSSDWYHAYTEGEEEVESMKVEWVTEPSEEHLDKSVTLAYGNEPSLGYHYHQLCVVAMFTPDIEEVKKLAELCQKTDDMELDEGKLEEQEETGGGKRKRAESASTTTRSLRTRPVPKANRS